MAKVKLTKTALKQQRDDLKQFQRFLPTLQLKKQQLQMEMRSCLERIRSNEVREKESKDSLSSWLVLFGAEADAMRVADTVRVERVETDTLNIAGVDVPRFKGVVFEKHGYDIYTEALWFDDAVAALKKIVELRMEREVIKKQYELIENELRVTTAIWIPARSRGRRSPRRNFRRRQHDSENERSDSALPGAEQE